MMVLDNITEVLVAILPPIITIISVLITGFLLPYLKNKNKLNTQEERKIFMENIKFWVDIAVKSAEQIYKDIPKSGKDKKAYVLNYLNQKGFEITEEDLDVLIESAVKELKIIEKEWLE